MLPKYIKVENFSSYVNETLNFEEWGDIVALVGENGSGKSSIIHMITTCLFFRAPAVAASGAGMEEFIHGGADYFKIEFCFKMDSKEYLIIRTKTKKNQTLKLFIDGVDNSGKLVETQKKINEIIKMDYETFMDTVIIGQGESASFMKKSSTERKKIISQILHLDKYDVLENYTKDIKKDIKTKLTFVEQTINDLYNKVLNKEQDKLEYDQIIEQLENIDSELIIKEKLYKEEFAKKTEHEHLVKQQESIISRKSKIKSSINSYKSEIIKLENTKLDIENVISKKNETTILIEKISSEIEIQNKTLSEKNIQKVSLQTENKTLNSKITELKNKFSRLKNYNECNCQFCGQNIHPSYKETHLKEIMNEGKTLQLQCNKNDELISQLTNSIQDCSKLINELNMKLRNEQNLMSKINIAEVKRESIINRINDITNLLNDLLNEEKELDNIEIINIEDKQFNDVKLNYEVNQLRQLQNNLNIKKGVLQNKQKQTEQYEKKYNENLEEYNNLKKQINLYEDLQKAWGKNGIQAIIIDNILPQIEDEINKYLKILSDDKIFIKFITQKENKSGNKSETLEIIVSDSMGSRSYERYSGGQKTRIDFACHIGMSKFLAKRSGANIDLFVVDEGIGTLDDAGKQNFLDTINLLGGIFKQVMVISHIPDIVEAFDNKIIVTNDIFNGSKVNVIK